MSRCALLIVVLGSAVLAMAAAQRGSESVEELVKRAESSPAAAQAQLYVQAAERQLQSAKDHYDKNEVEAGHAEVKDVVSYSEKACEATKKADNRLKSTEIALRKMADRLRGIQRTLAFEDQKPSQTAADRLETLRTELLGRMFQKNKK